MTATIHQLADTASDNPVPLLTRTKVEGERILLAHVQLEKGCHVATHSHENEQVAYIVSGRVKWRLGAEGEPGYREEIVEGGTVIVLPSHFPHGVDALEDTLIIDILSPPGAMGVDSQK